MCRPAAGRSSRYDRIDDPTRAGELTTAEQTYVEALCARCPAFARVRALATAFRRLLAERDAAAFGPWLTAAAASELHGFAAGLQHDRDAVLAAVLFHRSNGQV